MEWKLYRIYESHPSQDFWLQGTKSLIVSSSVQGKRKDWYINLATKSLTTVCPVFRVFWDQSLAELSPKRPERLLSATDVANAEFIA